MVQGLWFRVYRFGFFERFFDVLARIKTLPMELLKHTPMVIMYVHSSPTHCFFVTLSCILFPLFWFLLRSGILRAILCTMLWIHLRVSMRFVRGDLRGSGGGMRCDV